MFTIEQVVMFVNSSEKGSFSAAARNMKKSHSAISIAIANLEDELGVQLFDRSAKYPQLTADGERFYQQSKLLLRQAERMQAAANSSVDKVEHNITIGLEELVPFTIVETVIEKAATRYPHTKFSVIRNSGDCLRAQLENGEINIVVASNNSGMTRVLDFYAIAELPMVTVCSPDSDLADLDFVDNETLLATRQLCCSSMLDNPILKAAAQVSPEVWRITDQDDLLKLVEQGLGWAGVPKVMADERVALGTLKIFQAEFSCIEPSLLIDLMVAPTNSKGPVQQYIEDELKQIASYNSNK